MAAPAYGAIADEVQSLIPLPSWSFRTGSWKVEGLDARRGKKERPLRFALETPVAMWGIQNAAQISDSQVIFQLGTDQICLLDAATKKIALITRGRGPVVAKLKKNTTDQK